MVEVMSRRAILPKLVKLFPMYVSNASNSKPSDKPLAVILALTTMLAAVTFRLLNGFLPPTTALNLTVPFPAFNVSGLRFIVFSIT